MNQLLREIEDDLRQDRLEQLWKKHAGLVLFLAFLIVAVTALSVGWKAWREKHLTNATAQLVEVLDQARQARSFETVKQPLEAFAKNAPVGQAILARLQLAAQLSQNGQKEQAIQTYDQISREEKGSFSDMARILSAYEQLDSADPQKLKDQVAPLLSGHNPWRFSGLEIVGLLNLRLGKKEEAAENFRSILRDVEAPAALRERAQNELALTQGM